MVPPIWLDEQGRQRPTRACPRCGREAPLYRFPIDVVRRVGWQLVVPTFYVNYCGHRQEVIPLPERGGWARLVPIIGEAG